VSTIKQMPRRSARLNSTPQLDESLGEKPLRKKPLRKNPNTPLQEQSIEKDCMVTIVTLMMTSRIIPESGAPAHMDIDQLRASISELNIRKLLKIRTALNSPPTEAATQIARTILKRIHNYDFSGRVFDATQVHLMSIVLFFAKQQALVYPLHGWHFLMWLVLLSGTLTLSDELDKVKANQSWREWLSSKSWRKSLSNSTAERNGADAKENAGLDLMLLSDRRGTALAAGHIREVGKAIDVLLHSRMHDVKESDQLVFNQHRESLGIEWDNITFSEKVMWVASAQSRENENGQRRPTLDKTKLKCDLLQSTRHGCSELLVTNLVANDNAQSYELAARLLNASSLP